MLLESMTGLFQKEIFRICGSFLSRTILFNHHFFYAYQIRAKSVSIKIKLVLEEAGIDTRILGISELKSKRSQLLSDLWWLQSAIISRRDITRADKNFSET